MLGYRLHGDLHFHNIIVHKTSGDLMLIDWEMSEFMPLGYDFAMFYTFICDPTLQVEAHLRSQYEHLPSLHTLWRQLLPRLLGDLGIPKEDLVNATLFRMGTGWLYHLKCALERGEHEKRRQWERKLRDLTGGKYFELFPITA